MKKMYAVIGMALLMSGTMYAGTVTVVNKTQTLKTVVTDKNLKGVQISLDKSSEPRYVGSQEPIVLSVGEDDTHDINKLKPGFYIKVRYTKPNNKGQWPHYFKDVFSGNYESFKDKNCTITVTGDKSSNCKATISCE